MQPNPTRFDRSDLAASAHPAMIVRNGVVVDANDLAVSTLGDGLIGSEIADVVSDGDREGTSLLLLSGTEPAPPRRISFTTETGPRLAETAWYPVVFDGDPATLVVWRDVTDAERVPAWLSAITDSSMDLIGITDLSGNLLYMNDALMRLRGERSRDALPDGRNAGEHAAPGQSDIIASLLDHLAEGGSWRGELMFQGADGFVPVDAVIERSEVAGQVVYSLIGRDMSDELELRTELRDAIEARDSFVAHVAHEIKNPLSGIVGMALVLRDETEPTPVQREMLDLLIAGAADVQRIVEDLASLSTDITTPLRIVAVPVDLEAVAGMVIETIETGDDVDIVLAGSGVCIGDEVRIRQVLRNLLTNAVRYGGPDVRVEIDGDGDRVSVTVSDDGDGVPDDFTEEIFENFSSAHNTVEDSMGVGLAVSRQLTIGMGGSLSYDRRDGRTRFTMDLPAAPPT